MLTTPLTGIWTGTAVRTGELSTDPGMWRLFASSRTVLDLGDDEAEDEDDDDDEDIGDDDNVGDEYGDVGTVTHRRVFRRIIANAERFRLSIMMSADERNLQEAIDRSILAAEFVPNPAPAELVASLERAVVSEAGGTCPICQDDLEVGDLHFVFRCRHVMHAECSEKWFENGRACPVCMLPPWPVTEEPRTIEPLGE